VEAHNDKYKQSGESNQEPPTTLMESWERDIDVIGKDLGIRISVGKLDYVNSRPFIAS